MSAAAVSKDPVPIRPGDLLLGKYAIERVLATGGMGTVVSARHVELRRPVAIKLMLPALAARAEMVERFLREARAAASIQSEHVCRVLDVGTTPEGVAFMVLEHLEGEDLSTLLWRTGPIPADRAVGYVLQACEAIAEAHVSGIVHRDLKPANLFLAHRPDGTTAIKVLDFGISKALFGDDGRSLTTSTRALGTPDYMAPEQIRTPGEVDLRADIWALGVTLHELVCGRRPFEAESMPQMVAQILESEPQGICPHRPELPAELQSAILRCLRKRPGDRFQSLAELAEQLVPFAPPESEICAARVARMLGDDAMPLSLRAAQSRRRVPLAAPEIPTVAPTQPAPLPARRPRWRRFTWVLVACASVAGIASRFVGGQASSTFAAEEPILPPPAQTPAPPPSVVDVSRDTAQPRAAPAPSARPSTRARTSMPPPKPAPSSSSLAPPAAPVETVDAWDRRRFGGRK